MMSEQAIVAYFKILSQMLYGRTKSVLRSECKAPLVATVKVPPFLYIITFQFHAGLSLYELRKFSSKKNVSEALQMECLYQDSRSEGRVTNRTLQHCTARRSCGNQLRETFDCRRRPLRS